MSSKCPNDSLILYGHIAARSVQRIFLPSFCSQGDSRQLLVYFLLEPHPYISHRTLWKHMHPNALLVPSLSPSMYHIFIKKLTIPSIRVCHFNKFATNLLECIWLVLKLEKYVLNEHTCQYGSTLSEQVINKPYNYQICE